MLYFFSLTFILLGCYILIKQTFANKPICIFGLSNQNREFLIKDEGKYAISTIKGKSIDIISPFKVKIVHQHAPIVVEPKVLKYRNVTYDQWQIGSEFMTFTITKSGQYSISFENPENLMVKEADLFSKGQILYNIKTEHLQIAIKRHYAFFYKIVAILLIYAGILLMLYALFAT